MPFPDDRERQALLDLANALQTAAPVADRLRVVAGDLTAEATALHAAIDRAVSALRKLGPDGGAR